MRQVFIANKRRKLDSVAKEHPGAEIIDVTSKAESPWVKFSPFYPHGNIPVPFSEDYRSYSVEGLWQGLKVFESQDVDISKFEVQTMKGIKRTVRSLGKVLGHRKGVVGSELLSYADARRFIYIPSYRYVLETHLNQELEALINLLERRDVVLLDYEINPNVDDLGSPLSHASLIAQFIRDAAAIR